MKVYIAGKITGNPNYKADFQKARYFFSARQGSYEVLDPSALPEGMTPADYMQICFSMLFAADAVAFLPNTHNSGGADLEYRLARYIGKEMIFLEDDPVFMDIWRYTT